ncbi:MAG TPA: alpha/beta hydrolase [Thermomicrobiales bacterium]|nr:alpha/beta hydrolase [Thermomicrobiales bacterium]
MAATPAGAGAPPVVLVHGFVISSRYMVPAAEQLARQYPVYAPDLPGFGRSTKPGRALSLTELADALVAWLDVMGLEQPVLLGNSFGCQVIADLAVRYPDRLARAVLIGPTIDRHRRTALQQIARLQLDMLREPASLPLLHIPDYVRAGPRRIFRTYQEMMRDRIEENLPLISIPTLVVRGTRDPVAPRDWVEEVTRLLPAGRLAMIPGAAHAVNYNAPLELARLVRGFLSDETCAEDKSGLRTSWVEGRL